VANTWLGPVTSSNWTNGKASNSTTRIGLGADRGITGMVAKGCLGKLVLSSPIIGELPLYQGSASRFERVA
jgi:hypothetical protein